eukprot:CAMPEP_0172470198 /NCGR_PEP_ID=MMETSP1065-20121228/65732_1 /TAXON_ID=265537 /ORGANISM="Amphiprora paludosa, Strain CCMP125" /LENGTH=50 /DNA_ID=CAMNT_0013228061 /DNA_START=26 /DNA_END=175 /DNA_ORIENTATION=+
MKAQTVLEVGVFTGYTTLIMAQVSSVKRVVGLDVNPQFCQVGEPFWKQAG